MKTLAEKAAEELQRALDVYIPSFRITREGDAGISWCKVTHTPCPALTRMNEIICHINWHKDMEALREASWQAWQIREKHLGDLLDLALADIHTTGDDVLRLQLLWHDVIAAAYPE